MSSAPVQNFVLGNLAVQIVFALAPFLSECLDYLGPTQASACSCPCHTTQAELIKWAVLAVMIPLYIYRNKHPTNLICLGAFVSHLHINIQLSCRLTSCFINCSISATVRVAVTSLCCLMQTLCLSVSVGAACSVYAPAIVLEAVVLTAAIVGGLAAYSFHATRKGKDFT